ncbi:MAG: hypothetical protein M5U28_07430 [Sandaracinaceae bacterium]|nr:hypothetical protein [Sandaracinaceae bacterium]
MRDAAHGGPARDRHGPGGPGRARRGARGLRRTERRDAEVGGFITGPGDLPRTVGLVDATHSARMVRVTVTGLRMGANVVQRRAVFTFVPHATRILRMDLLRACVGVSCPSDQTCGAEGCRAIEVGPQELLAYDPGAVRRLDGGVPPSDGATDGGCTVEVEACNGADDDCDGDVDEDFDLSRDMLNCGSCGNACPVDPDNAASLCESGGCILRCDSGFEDCNGEVADGCEAVLSKPAHCGECGVSCSGGTPLCQPGASEYECVATCEAGRTDCEGACVDVSSDPLRCGGCDTRCTSPANAVATCMAGSCGFECDDGFADCDGDPANGCESTLRELGNCGRCGVRCELPGGVTSCATGSCLLVGCEGSLGDCDGEADNGCEADLASLATCGTCENACPTGLSQASVACVSGACQLTCDAGFGNCDARIDNGCEQSLCRRAPAGCAASAAPIRRRSARRSPGATPARRGAARARPAARAASTRAAIPRTAACATARARPPPTPWPAARAGRAASRARAGSATATWTWTTAARP